MDLATWDDDAPVPRGLPRPRASGLPIPYVTKRGWLGDVRWREVHWVTDGDQLGRGAECVTRFRCQVCGEDCPDDDLHVVVNRPNLSRDPMWTRDSGPLHLQCARLAYATCPHLLGYPDAVLLAVTRSALEIMQRSMTMRCIEVAFAYQVVGEWREVDLAAQPFGRPHPARTSE